jgi:hypothetical protein
MTPKWYRDRVHLMRRMEKIPMRWMLGGNSYPDGSGPTPNLSVMLDPNLSDPAVVRAIRDDATRVTRAEQAARRKALK